MHERERRECEGGEGIRRDRKREERKKRSEIDRRESEPGMEDFSE